MIKHIWEYHVPRGMCYFFRDLTRKLKDTHPVLCSFLLMLPPSSTTEHQNYFGIDENLGPVAVSIRREKVEDAKEREGSQFNYRVAFRTSEVSEVNGLPSGADTFCVSALGCFR